MYPTVSGRARPAEDMWHDAEGTPIAVNAHIEQTGIDTELGALHSRLGKRGRVLRRSATLLVVRFEPSTLTTGHDRCTSGPWPTMAMALVTDVDRDCFGQGPVTSLLFSPLP